MPRPNANHPRVAVVGLNSRLARQVWRQCHDFADLVFIDADRARTEFPCSVEFILFSRFVPHRAYVAARGLPRIFCPGGLATIVGQVSRIARALRPCMPTAGVPDMR